MEINRKEIVAAVVIILLAILFVRQNPQPVEPGSSYLTPQQVSLTGIYLCLPHRDTSGPQTMECALGMQTDDGAYYALDFNSAQIPSTLRAGDRLLANGVLTPVEMLGSDHWRLYPIKGILSVTDSVKIK